MALYFSANASACSFVREKTATSSYPGSMPFVKASTMMLASLPHPAIASFFMMRVLFSRSNQSGRSGRSNQSNRSSQSNQSGQSNQSDRRSLSNQSSLNSLRISILFYLFQRLSFFAAVLGTPTRPPIWQFCMVTFWVLSKLMPIFASFTRIFLNSTF